MFFCFVVVFLLCFPHFQVLGFAVKRGPEILCFFFVPRTFKSTFPGLNIYLTQWSHTILQVETCLFIRFPLLCQVDRLLMYCKSAKTGRNIFLWFYCCLSFPRLLFWILILSIWGAITFFLNFFFFF